jgi:hypothetical protein
MQQSIILGLIQNIAILLAFTMIYDYFFPFEFFFQMYNGIINTLYKTFGPEQIEEAIGCNNSRYCFSVF